MKIGIIGHGEDKFTKKGKDRAKDIIAYLLSTLMLENFEGITLVSGHSPVGGIDIWAEEIAKKLNVQLDLKIPKQKKWNAEYGYRQRNIDIAKNSDELHVILVDKLPFGYAGMRWDKCYHCNTAEHIKSGACWTAKVARKLGKKVIYHIVNQ